MLKKCFKCGKEKERSEFYAHPRMTDGLLGKCKECAKKDATEHRNKNLDKIRQYDLNRAKLPHRRIAMLKTSEKFRRENPLARPAHSKVRRAIVAGTLNKPSHCSLCGKETFLYGHHRDYRKPLEVTWVCQPCHKQIHKDLRKQAAEAIKEPF